MGEGEKIEVLVNLSDRMLKIGSDKLLELNSLLFSSRIMSRSGDVSMLTLTYGGGFSMNPQIEKEAMKIYQFLESEGLSAQDSERGIELNYCPCNLGESSCSEIYLEGDIRGEIIF